MSKLEERIRQAITASKAIRNPKISVYQYDLPHDVFVAIESEAFVGMPEPQRQKLVWTALREGLTEEEQAYVRLVLTDLDDLRAAKHG
jgi:stress-induced morphogen